jgi:hypothetical protein
VLLPVSVVLETDGFCSDVRVFFEAGKNHYGYFASKDVLEQAKHAIATFERNTSGRATGLFLYDNAPSHQKRSDNVLSARYIPKRPNEGWTRVKGGPRMRNSWVDWCFPNGVVQRFAQPLYFPDNHPKY